MMDIDSYKWFFSSNPIYDDVYSMQIYMLRLISSMQQTVMFVRLLHIDLPINLPSMT